MPIKEIQVQRFSVTSKRSFDEVVAALHAAIGHTDVRALTQEISQSKNLAEMETIIHKVVDPSGLMEFVRFDLGDVVRKERPAAPRSLRLVAGNPLIMKEMVKRVPDAGSYAPVTILIDERPDGVHLSYDRMASFLASYGNPEALKVAEDLDAKVEAVLTKAANASKESAAA